MITDKITVYGEKQEAEIICDLLKKCITQSEGEFTPVDVYLWETSGLSENFDSEKIHVVPYNMKGQLPEKSTTVTYSDADSSADVSTLNLQKRKDSLCFELLCGVFMSRIFIPDESEYTQRQVLVCASVLYALGMPMKKVVSLINESLK